MPSKMLGEAVLTLLKSFKRAAECGFEVSLENEETGKCFLIIVLYFCDTPEAKDMYAVLHGAGNSTPALEAAVRTRLW